MKLADPANSDSTILDRMVRPDEPTLSVAAAKSILKLDFSAADHARMNELSAKAQAGTLTPDEQEEAETYGRIGSFLGVLQSKARRSLRGRSGPGKTRSSR